MSSNLEIVDALAAALEPLRSEIPDLQIYPYWIANPTPPTIDIYPDNPFSQGTGFGDGHDLTVWVVRARVTTADQDGGQRELLSMMDPNASTSIGRALVADQTLAGVIETLGIGSEGNPGVSGYIQYTEDAASGGKLLGAQWRVEVYT